MTGYKVLTERDSRFGGQFDAESLEATLNSYASERWRVVDSAAASSTWKNMNASIMVIPERELSDPEPSARRSRSVAHRSTAFRWPIVGFWRSARQ